jgi:hypothetical protein
MNRSFIFLFILIFSLFFSFNVEAQGVPVAGGGIDLTASADSPVPGQKVTITARSYSININSSTLTWTINGKVAQKGVGLTTLEVLAPDLGKTLNIVVGVLTTDNISLSNNISIGSGSVDMLMEGNGHVPPFFKGKIPIAYQNMINVIAVPHLADSKGVEYDPKTLVYQWNKNSRAVEDQSGYGKQTFTLVGDIVPRATNLNVIVSTRDGSRRASGYISVPYNSPSLTFYEDSPLYGPLYNQSIGQSIFIGKEKETSVLGVPYGFNKPITGLGNLVLTWMINGYERPELTLNESVTLRAPDGADGTSNVELTVTNSKDILQTASAGFMARFSSKSSTPVSSGPSF